MSACVVCEHEKRAMIDAALLSGRHLAVVARQFRVAIEVLTPHHAQEHYRHQPSSVKTPQREELGAVVATRAGVGAGHLSNQPMSDEIDMEALQTQVSPMRRTSAQSMDAGQQGLDAEEACGCNWCRVSPYRRLLRAWREASRLDRERLAIEAQMPEPPF